MRPMHARVAGYGGERIWRTTAQLAVGLACWWPAVAHAMDRVTLGPDTGIETSRLSAQLLVELPQGLPTEASVYVEKIAEYTFRVSIARRVSHESHDVNLSDVALADRERVLAVSIAEALRVTVEPVPPPPPVTAQRDPAPAPTGPVAPTPTPHEGPPIRRGSLGAFTVSAGAWIPLARPLALATIDANYRFAAGSTFGIPLGLRGIVGQTQDALGTARAWGVDAELGLSIRIMHSARIVSDVRALLSVGFVKGDGLASGGAQGESVTGYSSTALLRYDAYLRFADHHAVGIGATAGGILHGPILFADDRESLRMLGPFAGLQLSYVR